MKYKHYTYKDAELHKSKHELIVPDFDASLTRCLADLVRIELKKSPKKYILVDEKSANAMVVKMAVFYNFPPNDAIEYYSQKETEYMLQNDYYSTEHNIFGNSAVKQYAFNETYAMLKKTTINGILSNK